jgi:hypothetical protein
MKQAIATARQTVGRPVRAAAKASARHFGYEPLAVTPPDELRSLLARLRPVTTDVPLIRMGPDGDGGYLVPDDLENIVACFSPGVANSSGFELQCAERGMDIFMADASVDGPADHHPRFNFVKKFIGPVDDHQTIGFEQWAHDSLQGRRGDLMLQMDIEGAEWTTLPTVPTSLLQRFRIVVIELHMLEHLFTHRTFNLLAPVLDRLLSSHMCVHLHPNNCCGSVTRQGIELPQVLEATFLRRDRAEPTGFVSSFPHPLDIDNTPEPSIVLPPSMTRH